MRGFDIKQIPMRSFQISGLTAKWGIGDSRDDRYKNPLHAWTISGRADGSEDFSPLLDKMGTGNVLTLSGFDGTSGFEDGYLVFDGVDDAARTSNFLLSKNWTVIGDWEFTTEAPNNAGFVKGPRFYIYNTERGVRAYINQSSFGTPLTGVRSLRAVCSDGRLYDSDWKLYTNVAEQVDTDSKYHLGIGLQGTNFTSMRFKNLAIYEGAPLSEAQCKKAYDWLQTL